MRILVVEDDPTVSRLLQQAIREEGHSVVLETDGAEAYQVARFHGFDAIVLDVMLPGMDGFEIARRLRREGDQTPILMLTARDTDRDVVRGLNLGADDYLVKPFSLDVFFARLNALSRRQARPISVMLKVADLEMDTGAHEVRRRESLLNLTRTEYSLLELLLRNAGRVLPREQIIEAVWGYGASVENNTLDAFVSSLRAKVDADGAPRLIRTVRGVGYSLREHD
jgi:two-component system response regulator MprA